MFKRFLAFAPAVVCVLALTTRAADEPTLKSGPEVGKDLPGPFHPYNVTGKRAGDFHDVLSAQGLDPAVLIFVRGTEAGDALQKLLADLDAIAEKTSKTRIAVAAVFLADDLKDVVKNDDLRKKYAEKLETIKTDAKLNSVILCLDSADGPKEYALNANAEVTVLLSDRLKVLANYAFAKGGLTKANVDAIVAAVKEKLSGAKK
jgi:hypothetical protein